MKYYYNGCSKYPGIYELKNVLSGRSYVGQTKEFKHRWVRGHKESLIRNVHRNRFLQNDFNKCLSESGNDDFIEFHILEVMPNSSAQERNEREIYWIEQFTKKHGKERLYNLSEGGAVPTMSEATRQKISAAKKEYYKTEDGKALIQKIAASKQGKTYEELYGADKAVEIKQKIRENKLVEMNRPEVKENLRRLLSGKTEVERYGEEKAQEIKEKRSRARKGKYTAAENSRFKKITNIRLQAPDGTVYTNIEGIKEFSKAHDLQQNHLSELLAGKRNSHHGWMLVKDDTL